MLTQVLITQANHDSTPSLAQFTLLLTHRVTPLAIPHVQANQVIPRKPLLDVPSSILAGTHMQFPMHMSGLCINGTGTRHSSQQASRPATKRLQHAPAWRPFMVKAIISSPNYVRLLPRQCNESRF